jgi:hypothetical protein
MSSNGPSTTHPNKKSLDGRAEVIHATGVKVYDVSDSFKLLLGGCLDQFVCIVVSGA